MTRYIVKPAQGPRGSRYWTDSAAAARDTRRKLQEMTGIEWQIIRRRINDRDYFR